MDWWQGRLDVCREQLERLGALLSTDELERSRRFYFERDRRRFIAGRGTLRLLLAHYTGGAPAELVLAYGAQGKPSLQGGHNIPFNLSHSEDVVLYAVASGDVAVGIDVEHISNDIDTEDIARLFFSQPEVTALERLDPPQRRTGFYAIWTAKEAYVKAVGDGLVMPLQDFAVGALANGPRIPITMLDDPTGSHGWHLSKLDAPQGFAAAIAIQSTG